jgi:uncharacterized protein YjiS (DUF1127 family)
MNGLSDVRLALRQQELLADAEPQALRGQAPVDAQGGRWRLFWRRLSTRRALLELDEAQLKDVGLTRAQALAEALRPFWRL